MGRREGKEKDRGNVAMGTNRKCQSGPLPDTVGSDRLESVGFRTLILTYLDPTVIPFTYYVLFCTLP